MVLTKKKHLERAGKCTFYVWIQNKSVSYILFLDKEPDWRDSLHFPLNPHQGFNLFCGSMFLPRFFFVTTMGVFTELSGVKCLLKWFLYLLVFFFFNDWYLRTGWESFLSSSQSEMSMSFPIQDPPRPPLCLLQSGRWWLQPHAAHLPPGQRRMARGLPWSPWQWNGAETGRRRRPAGSDGVPGPEPRNHHRPHRGDAGKHLPLRSEQEFPRYDAGNYRKNKKKHVN